MSGVGAGLGTLTARVGLDTSTLQAQAGVARAELKGVGSEATKAGGETKGSFAGVGVGIAAVGAAAGLVYEGLKKLSEGTAEVRRLKATFGSTAEEASKLRNVAVGLGIDTDTLTKGVGKLSKSLQAGKTDFAGVHVEIAKNKDGSSNLVGTLNNMRTAYQSLHDPIQKNAFLLDAFGKSGLNLRAVMSLTNAEFEKVAKHGPFYSQKDLDSSLKLARAQTELKQAIETVEVGLAKGLVPALTSVEHGFTAVTRVVGSLHLPVGQIVEIGVGAVALAKGVTLLGTGFTAASAGVGRLTAALTGEAAAAAAATAVNEGAAASTVGLGAASAGAGVAAGAAAAKTGLFAGAVAGFSALPLVGQVALVVGALLVGSKQVDNHVGTLKHLDEGFVHLERRIPLVGGALAGLDSHLLGGAASAGKHKDAIEADSKSLKEVEGVSASVGAGFQVMGSAAIDLAGDQNKLATSFNEATTAAKMLKQGLDVLIGVHLSAEAAADNYESKLDSLRTTFEKNGHTLDGTTEAGRKNRAGIRDLISATEDEIVAMQNEGKSNEEVSAKYADHVQALRNTMSAAGYTKDEIERVINKLGLLAASPNIEKSVTVNTYENTYIRRIVSTMGDAYVGAMAEGGFVDRPMMALIGEAGRELVLPLTDMRRTAELLGQAGLIAPFGSSPGAGSPAPAGASMTTSSRTVNIAVAVDSPNARDIAREIDWRMSTSGAA